MDFRLKPKISCDCVCEDNYGVENLINPIPKEFIAYSCVKPPISIKINLICRIHLDCVKIWAKVGSLKSTAFELSAGGQILGYGKCDADSQVGMYFYNAKTSPQSTPSFSAILLKNNPKKPISDLQITVRRTRGCAIVIKKIEIYGQPAEKCPEVENLPSSSRSQIHHFETNDSPPPCDIVETDDGDVPEDFLDAITCSMMVIPYTLPSGKVIDRETLEKCNQTEAEWGRSPSDPFTGLTFMRHRRPVFNAALKARIDHFLLTNTDKPELKYAPRTVGTYLKRQQSSSSPPKAQKVNYELLPLGTPFEAQLQAAVDSLKNAQQTTNNSSEAIPEKICQKCDNEEHLYEINKCKHFICRNCLLSAKEVRMQCKISNCNVCFSKNDVVKYHNTGL